MMAAAFARALAAMTSSLDGPAMHAEPWTATPHTREGATMKQKVAATVAGSYNEPL
jgi:hypothetical protein